MPNFAVTRYGTDSSGRAIYMTAFMAEWLDGVLEWCKQRGFEPVVTQGAFMARAGGGATASAGYHDAGGCLDFRTWNLTAEQRGMFIRECRRRGAAAWYRDAKHGGMDPHIHITLGCDRPLTSGALASWTSYLRGENGLTGSSAGRDYHWRPDPLVTTWAPEPEAKPTPNITAALRAPDATSRKIALRTVIRHGSRPAKRAARTWLNSILALEAARAKAKAARRELARNEVR